MINAKWFSTLMQQYLSSTSMSLGDITRTHQNMTGSLPATITRVDYFSPLRTVFTFTAHPVTITHAAGTDGWGSLNLGAFPSIPLRRSGTAVNLTLTGGAGVSATAAGVLGLGTDPIAAAAASLTANMANISPSGAFTLAASAATVATVGGGSQTVIDGVNTARTLYLNFAGVTTTSTSTMTLNGTITTYY